MGNPVKGGTIYRSAADVRGMTMSFIQSSYMRCGSGCVEPEFGISTSLQNRGYDFSLDAGISQVAPGKRPFHTLISAVLPQECQTVMSLPAMRDATVRLSD